MAHSATATSTPPRSAAASPPSAARLAELLTITEKRFLSPVEAAELRRSVEHLAACLTGAGGELRRLVRDAELQRDEHAREMAAVVTPGLSVKCRRCEAARGVWCRPVSGVVAPRTLHVVRLSDAGVLS
ncbi:hypothetical protein ACFXDE_01670 [Kitasatospora sp. NPDC059408]|uniref:hypothetical protein n=1 Tax=Kitasatospora sp. NPDC059408 TaxID=3346823 RepID=UPI0036B18C99